MLNLSIINNVTHSSHKPPLYPFLSKGVSLGFEYIKQPFSGPFDLFCPFWGDIIPRNTCPENMYFLKVNKISTENKCEICLKLTIRTPEQCR